MSCGAGGSIERPCCAGCAAAGTACGGACSGKKGLRYRVQAGDTPASIAAKFTGSSSRMRELLIANPGKPQSGGTFADLYIGEVLALPSNWGSLQGLGRRLLGLGQSPGANAVDATTLDTDVQAIVQEGVNGTLCQAGNQSVLQFQIDFDDIPYTGNDGKYGPNTATAAKTIISGAPDACAAFSSTPGVTTFQPSANLIALAQALDSVLATTAANTCDATDTTSAVPVAVYNFKQAALSPPGCTSTLCYTVAPGVTVNMSGNAAYAYGPGTDTLLGAVLEAQGIKRSYTGGPWTDSYGTCLATGGSGNLNPLPKGGGGILRPSGGGGGGGGGSGGGGAVTPPSSSMGYVIAGLVLVAAAGGGLYYMHKHPAARQGVKRVATRAHSTVRGALGRGRRTATA